MHWPQATPASGAKPFQPEESPTIVETWKEMEKLLQSGKVRSIGVSNFSIKLLRQVIDQCNIVPAVNQVEMHPCLPRADLKSFCDEKKIILTAYSPLGKPSDTATSETLPSLLENDIIADIASKLGVTPSQVLLSWNAQRGSCVIPKSEREARLKANLTLVKIAEGDIRLIDNMHTYPSMHRSLLPLHHWNGRGIFGWTYEQLGWDMVAEGFARNDN